MNLQNLPCIIGVGGNTNFGNCNFNLKNAKALLFTPAGYKVPVSALPTFIATINTLLHADDRYNRAQIVTGIKGVEKANIEAATATWGDGSTVETRDERIGRNYQMQNVCAFVGLSTLKEKHDFYDVWPIYDGNVVQGTKATMDDGEDAVSGFDLSRINATQYDEAMNETQAQFLFYIELAIADEWRNMVAFAPEDGTLIKDLNGMQTMELSWIKQTPPTPGTYHIKATASCGSVNMGEVYGDELESASLWIATNPTTGNIIPITGVTRSGLNNFIVALDTTSADYTAATKIKITTVPPSGLGAVDIEWYESTSTVFPK